MNWIPLSNSERMELRRRTLSQQRFDYLRSKYRETKDHKYVRMASREGFDLDWTPQDDQFN